MWSNGTLTNLGAPSLLPAAINDRGVIVGGQLVDSGGTVQNLNTLIPAGSGYQIQDATGINDNGQTHALLLTPTDDPSTMKPNGCAMRILLCRRNPSARG